MSDEFLTTAEVGAMLKIPVGTLRQWRHRGFGPRGFAMGGTVRYRRSVVEKWIADQEHAELDGAA
ncbi:helix-turn-helix domain-containing protein [Frankia sp. CcI49]|uniref:helix-turn-helix transcriptional regulator n=1 Tax=Frankia sp. CcI49 TaxID=1745382 RepID=UPI0009FF3DFF|nr:helix-turn-helix domain-containing protein [Frankia sp. CcI49]